MKKMVIALSAGILLFSIHAQAQVKPRAKGAHRPVTIPSHPAPGQVKGAPVPPVTKRPARMPLPPAPPPPPLPPQS